MTAPTREQITKWALDCDIIDNRDLGECFIDPIVDDLQRFATLAYAAGQTAEREACAQLLEERSRLYTKDGTVGYTIANCASIIRARSDEPTITELQAAGKGPAPCARFCEANAYQIEIRRLKGEVARAVAVEREACAKVCDTLSNVDENSHDYRDGANWCAELIRARGTA